MAVFDARIVWRISNHIELNGEGGRKKSARWHTAGSRIVYLAESPSAALVETLAHLEVDSEDTPDTYNLLKIFIPQDIAIQQLDPPVGAEWKQELEMTRRIGDAWLAALETPLARVPSAIAPETWNYLLNPEHPEAGRVEIVSVIKERFDNRLFRFGAR